MSSTPAPPQPPPARPLRRWLLLAALGVGLAAGLPWAIRWLAYRFTHSISKDAFIESHLINVAPQVAGAVVEVRVQEQDLVRKGQLLAVIDTARERKPGRILPSTYVLAVTQEIGQDKANDVSDIAVVRERLTGDPIIRPVAENLRIYHEHAAYLAAAYALSEGIEAILWSKNRRHGWA